ncbi:hypothetical protein [Thiocystis violacea]|uniref:hypothetical protein n=1 Tax=Thiocystis violacea TaxID=13725 RepID=UPI0019038A3A|nr:hypothetical protein [Thiocystis violacea]MBK1723133.1 hypothetical protein [Thiocystis violacea]
MSQQEPTEDDLIRLLVNAWVARRAGTLDSEQRAVLERERPHWECEAATLIAEGILGYVTVEMVEPDLAYNRTADSEESISQEELAARLGAHMLDFVDYRDDLARVRGAKPH